MDDLIVPIGLPITILVIVAVALCVVSMAFSRGSEYPAVQEYKLGEPWTHAPYLFSATGIQPMALASHAEETDVDGGSASGKW